MFKARRHLLAASVVALGAVSCQAPKDRLLHANYLRVEPGVSTRADVRELLGEPDSQLGDLWLFNRPNKHLLVQVEFDDDGRVTRRQWIDARVEVWEDSQDPGAEELQPDPPGVLNKRLYK